MWLLLLLVLACYTVFSLLPRSTTDSQGGIRCRVWHLLSCLLLARGMMHVLIWTRTSNILRISRRIASTWSRRSRAGTSSSCSGSYKFMKTNPDTFCHGLTMHGKTVFIIQSVFATSLQIHERFDLKGSWVGRLEGRKPAGTIATCKLCNAEHMVGGSHDQRYNVLKEDNMKLFRGVQGEKRSHSAARSVRRLASRNQSTRARILLKLL